MWAWLGTVPPLPLNTVTAAFYAVYLCPVYLWLGSESYFIYSKLRSVIQTVPKSKKPSQDALWSWLLARATAKRMTLIKSSACCLARPHSSLRGFISVYVLMPLKTGWIIHTFLGMSNYPQTLMGISGNQMHLP
jgi:hypothetical protein